MRLSGIDIIRGICVIGMICFHANYILESVFFSDIIPISDTLWFLIGRSVAITFIVISGFSLYLSHERGYRGYSSLLLGRVAILGLLAGFISWVTFTFIPEQRIYWGIIHFFALVSLLSPLIPYLGESRVPIGLMIIVLGHVYLPAFSSHIVLLPFGWIPDPFFSADYYSLFPWIGYYMVGYSVAETLSREQRERWLIWDDFPLSASLIWIGKHSLLIYALHIPLLYFSFRFLFS